MRRLTTIKCEDCGQVVAKVWQNGRPRTCPPCGERRTLQAARDMATRSGPYYERWLAATGRRSTTKRNTGGVP